MSYLKNEQTSKFIGVCNKSERKKINLFKKVEQLVFAKWFIKKLLLNSKYYMEILQDYNREMK